MMAPVPISVCPLRGTGYHVSSSIPMCKACSFVVETMFAVYLRYAVLCVLTCVRMRLYIFTRRYVCTYAHQPYNVTCLMQQIHQI